MVGICSRCRREIDSHYCLFCHTEVQEKKLSTVITIINSITPFGRLASIVEKCVKNGLKVKSVTASHTKDEYLIVWEKE